MNTHPEKYTVLIVPGAWHVPEFFFPFIHKLEDLGHPTRVPLLPSCSTTITAENPNIDAHDDAQVVHDELSSLVEHGGKRVLLILHSYGAVPGIEAATSDLSFSDRHVQGKRGGVIGILCFAGLVVKVNTSLEDLAGGKPAPRIGIDPDGFSFPRKPVPLFFNDLPTPEAELWASRLVRQPARAHSTVMTHAAYEHFPMGYVYPNQEKSIPKEAQHALVQLVKDTGVEMHEYQIDDGHDFFLGHADATLGVIQKFMQDIGSIPDDGPVSRVSQSVTNPSQMPF